MVLVNVGQATFKTRTQYLVIQVISGIAGSVNDTIFQMTVCIPDRFGEKLDPT